MGEEKFRTNIRVKNIHEDLHAMAEVVIHQRCHGKTKKNNPETTD
jgi:hypothetical protein